MNSLLPPVFQVSEFNEAINNHLSLLGEVEVEGELSRLDIRQNKLIFGTLKDATTAMDIFSLTHVVKDYRAFEPGMLVTVRGTAGLYRGTSKFRFYASKIVPKGEGSLQIAYEKLKKALEAEGLFSPSRKRLLPPWPKRIGLVTAVGSSAHADLLKILTSRMPGLHLKTLPVNVQGREAINSILRAFSYIKNHATEFDVIIMARGGGSLEDLAAFNSEELCRAIFACPVPVVSAIGHEDNISLTDLVADLRASTPSNAAELTVKNSQDVLSHLDSTYSYIHQILIRHLRSHQSTVAQSFLQISRKLKNLTASVSQAIAKVPQINLRLKQLLNREQIQLESLLPQLKSRLKTAFLHQQIQVNQLERLLNSYDYNNVLKRGFTLTYQGDVLIKNKSHLNPQLPLTTHFSDGQIQSNIKIFKE